MLQSNRGYFLLDLLLSLSAMLLIGGSLVPLLIELRNQSAMLEISNQARQIVYEELHAKLTDNSFTDYTTTCNAIEYQIHWKAVVTGDLKEVCVKVEESHLHQGTEICGKLE
ncbi:hypothetical protein [Neobacillus muris]|uniref:hypothetical protein n=1 Tax=Neobacillus muris TaxID=2941334 RepID=UPI00203CA6DC|nr:hypothetical protein [Neobacillus muris]